MEMSEITQELSMMAKRLADFRGSLDLEEKETRIAELEEKMSDPMFWEDQNAAQKVINENNALKNIVNTYRKLESDHEELDVSLELLKEENDSDLADDLEQGVKDIGKRLNEFELELLLSEPHDKNNAILELHPGAGGTESQDWASMLLRMYTRWAEAKGFKVETTDYLPGDEAGVKSVTLLIQGHNAYGYLKAEKGVHRLVRISPFDSSGRRHTSFASCDVMPELDDNVEITVSPDDLRIDTFRSSGAGGQHVNTTDSAVRMTHLPTNTVVSCQSERSQIKNREKAMKMLKAKLFQQEMDKQRKEAEELRGEQSDIGWGSQIRSYVFHPYNMVKDHRTNVETGNTQAVMDGELAPFIDAYLRSQID
ncbi:peptide chain release factor 2 [Salipaludibacillus agaradhaerens]|uniref:Peptide chain release factor 2 n=1 Tax=Salipaludibacillus agaradhaerens TaxID=76935 RepID=A0A9Q4FXW9_SALAG|nr:peptide chain release factor 2 [Salipaludibacillus agaradhaerens]UJW59045.1 peptide chain release factor 2 [Bacillus sp. A116_S68]MCR6095118.1 peptide chain release factor 2 [Salipaludibacillus agaradhaerens]MCR6107969.1 peptide chain release factor 2 [Salipaludibacillus agaradhaerens]MCR6115324.1 peptide chain release factor 2 [Salipaludibacillus agaradhaerens]MCR6119995.1 peptide chain release factor 2 [Salipaludibacillus agaradhaerens]